jgi:mannitol-1-phosphate 5-dehydrogenase
VGNILHRSGYQILFVDVSDLLVDALNLHRGYPLQVIAPDTESTLFVDRITALSFDQREHIQHAVAECDLISTSIGPRQLPVLAPLLAGGLRRRFAGGKAKPVNIVPFENAYANGDLLRKLVFEYLSEEERGRFSSLCGFPNTTITVTAFDVTRDDPTGLLVGIDRPEDRELVADKRGFVAPVPNLVEILMTDQLGRYEDRKMFVAGAHAIGAYAAHRQAHTIYSKAMQQPELRRVLMGAVAEISVVSQQMHRFSPEEMKRYLDPLIARFCDLRFDDPVSRVAREPKRKLAPQERIVRPARFALQHGLDCDYLVGGIVDAFHYDDPRDKEAQELQKSLAETGWQSTLLEVTGISLEEDLGRKINERWRA